MQEEESLVRRAMQQDETAFTEIYEEYFDKIYRYIVLKIGDRTEAGYEKALESLEQP
ncbi:MAG: hypothetical protein QGI51_04070 [Dehalococcoidales bacterium]|nr:hypothetical protein [Dehalococcoidales bacterium]